MDIQIIEKVPSAADFNRLRAAAGWGVQDLGVAAEALPHSLFGVCAFAGDELVGMARVIGDGGLVYYVQDVVVLPAYQGQGIGARLMDTVMAFIRAHATPNCIVGLMAAKGKEGFYTRYGFVARPNEALGCGMTIFWM